MTARALVAMASLGLAAAIGDAPLALCNLIPL